MYYALHLNTFNTYDIIKIKYVINIYEMHWKDFDVA